MTVDEPIVRGALGPAADQVGDVAALQATVAQLEQALASSRTIGTAIGLIMERFHLDRVAAMAHLVRLSQDSNTKLFVVAERVVRSAEPKC